MMKKIIVAATWLAIGLGAMAVPAKPGFRTHIQSDGSKISVQMVGDERFHVFTTTDGLTVEQAPNGDFHYITPEGLSPMMAHDLGSRSADEATFLASNHEKATVTSLSAKATAARKAARSNAPQMKATQVPTNGSPRVPILLVAFKNVDFRDGQDAYATFKDFFETGDMSCRQYFVDQSNGKYTPEFDVYGPLTLSKNRSNYGSNNSWGNDKGVGAMVAEACNGLKDKIDFSRYDNDGDGECDVVVVLYAGVGEASSSVKESVWPCQWDLESSDYDKSLTLNGVKVNKFAVFNESHSRDGGPIDGIGTFCHEFSHCLGLPDFYETTYANGYFGMGNWSLLDAGCYADDGFTPIGYTAYEKEFMGWIDIPEGTENTHYTLPVFNQKSIDTDVAVKITNSRDKNEYYILENRARQGWDKYLPAEGMLITHVTYSRTAWDNNTVNNSSMQRMCPIPADNSLKMDYSFGYYSINEESLKGDLWPYGKATELTDTSVPSAKVNTGGYMSKPITEITRNASTSEVSFWLMKGAVTALSAPMLDEPITLDKTSFKATWTHPDLEPEAEVTYTLEVIEHRDLSYSLIAQADFTDASNLPIDWTTDGYTTHSANQGLRLGSSSTGGSLTSPLLTTGSHAVTSVAFAAKIYNEQANINVALIDAEGNEIANSDVTLASELRTYVVTFDTPTQTLFRVKLSAPSGRQRSIVASVAIYDGEYSEAEAAAPNKAASRWVRTIEGIDAMEATVEELPSEGKFDVRVKAVPTDLSTFAESSWSNIRIVELGNSSVAEIIATDPASAPTQYFTISGRRVNGIPQVPGIYIRRDGTNTQKIVVK